MIHSKVETVLLDRVCQCEWLWKSWVDHYLPTDFDEALLSSWHQCLLTLLDWFSSQAISVYIWLRGPPHFIHLYASVNIPPPYFFWLSFLFLCALSYAGPPISDDLHLQITPSVGLTIHLTAVSLALWYVQYTLKLSSTFMNRYLHPQGILQVFWLDQWPFTPPDLYVLFLLTFYYQFMGMSIVFFTVRF